MLENNAYEQFSCFHQTVRCMAKNGSMIDTDIFRGNFVLYYVYQ